MNVYLCIRTVLHSLLFIINLSALTTAALFISALSGQGHKATAGPVLIILGSILYAIATIGTWSEMCIARSKFSKLRTETFTIPVVFFFQLLGAIVSTVEATQKWASCSNQSFCVALVILSWTSTLALVIYFMITMIVTFYHYVLDEDVWDATPLAYNWFPLPSTIDKPEVPPKDVSATPAPASVAPAAEPSSSTAELSTEAIQSSSTVELRVGSIILPPPPTFPPPVPKQPRPLSDWMPPPVDLANKIGQAFTGPNRRFYGDNVAPPSSQNPFRNFTEIPLRDNLPVPLVLSTSGTSAATGTTRDSVDSSNTPSWVKKLRPAKRAVGLPFPVTAVTSRIGFRPLMLLNKDQDSRNIDAPVSPTSFPE